MEERKRVSIKPFEHFSSLFAGCEDLNLSTAPLSFVFSLSDGILAPREIDEWEKKSELERMVQVLRFQTCSGTDSFLLDAVSHS